MFQHSTSDSDREPNDKRMRTENTSMASLPANSSPFNITNGESHTGSSLSNRRHHVVFRETISSPSHPTNSIRRRPSRHGPTYLSDTSNKIEYITDFSYGREIVQEVFNLQNKTTDKKDSSVEIAKAYFENITESLPQVLGSLCKEIGHKSLSLTNDIDERKESTLKINSEDPTTIPRSLNLKIVLKAPDRHREKVEYQNLSKSSKDLMSKFKADATDNFKQNAEDVMKTLEEDRASYLISKMIMLAECFYAFNMSLYRNESEYETQIDAKKVAEHAVNFIIQDLNSEMADYLNLTENDLSRIFRENINLEPFTDAEHNLKMVKVLNDVIYDVRTHLHKLTYILKDLIERTKSEINLHHKLKSIITVTKTVAATEEMNMELDKEEPMNTKHMDEVINKIVDEKVQKKVKELAKRMAKNSSGGGKVLSSEPPKNGPPSNSSKKSQKKPNEKKSKEKKAENEKEQMRKDAKKKTKTETNKSKKTKKANRDASSKDGKKNKSNKKSKA